MNKRFLILLSFGLCLVIIVSNFLNDKNESLDKKIIGTWEPKLTIALITGGHSSDPLVFMSDKTMERLSPSADTVLGEVGGICEGIYEIKGNELTTALELPLFGSTVTMEQTYTIEIKGNAMSMKCMDCDQTIGYVKAK